MGTVPAPQEIRRGAGDGAGDGVDRISGLPDELLLVVLAGLRSVREAVRTGVLSRRWRCLWAGLPELDFDDTGLDPGTVDSVLAQVTRPALSYLHFYLDDVAYTRASSLLIAAARLAPERLRIDLLVDARDYDAIMLPCFDRTASLDLDVWGVWLVPPPSGEFAVLESLVINGSCPDLAAMVPMCPRLRVLEINDCWNVEEVVVHSASLEKLSVSSTNYFINRIDIDAPMLKELNADFEMAEELSVSFSAPMLEKLDWICYGEGIGVPGEIWSLLSISESNLDGYYVVSMSIKYNDKPMYVHQTFAQEIAQLPVANFSVLELKLETEGHAVGPLVWHLLRIRPVIQRLKVVLAPGRVRESSCAPNCPCEHLNDWRSESVGLTDLEEVEIVGFKGNYHEVDFLKHLFLCAIMLKKATVKISAEASFSNDRYKEICSIHEEYPHVDCYVYSSCGNQVLYP